MLGLKKGENPDKPLMAGAGLRQRQFPCADRVETFSFPGISTMPAPAGDPSGIRPGKSSGTVGAAHVQSGDM